MLKRVYASINGRRGIFFSLVHFYYQIYQHVNDYITINFKKNIRLFQICKYWENNSVEKRNGD